MNTITAMRTIPWPQLAGRYALDEQGNLFKHREARPARGITAAWLPRKVDSKTDRPGYRLNLTVKGIKTVKELSVAMLETYIGPAPSPLHVAAHLDGDYTNNSASNLAWNTRSEVALRKHQS